MKISLLLLSSSGFREPLACWIYCRYMWKERKEEEEEEEKRRRARAAVKRRRERDKQRERERGKEEKKRGGEDFPHEPANLGEKERRSFRVRRGKVLPWWKIVIFFTYTYIYCISPKMWTRYQ